MKNAKHFFVDSLHQRMRSRLAALLHSRLYTSNLPLASVLIDGIYCQSECLDCMLLYLDIWCLSREDMSLITRIISYECPDTCIIMFPGRRSVIV